MSLRSTLAAFARRRLPRLAVGLVVLCLGAKAWLAGYDGLTAVAAVVGLGLALKR